MELERLSFGNNCYLISEMKHSEQSMHNRSQLLLDDDAMKASARERVREAGIRVDTPKTVLVVVDVQWDFFDPAGALYAGGSEVLPEKIAELADGYDTVKAWLKGAQRKQ